jgi:hypothetical protein
VVANKQAKPVDKRARRTEVDRINADVAVISSPIQTRHTRIKECNFQVNPEFPGVEFGRVFVLDKFPVRFSSNFSPVEKSDTPRTFLGKLTVELSDVSIDEKKEAPYLFKIEVEGLFQCIQAELDKPIQQKLAASYGTASLLGTARELLAAITARAAHGAVILPSILFAPKLDSAPEGDTRALPAEKSRLKKKRK